MQGFLNSSQIDYVLYHLNLTLNLTETLRNHFVFQKDSSGPVPENKIVFLLSDTPFHLDKVIHEGGVPILFPGKKGVGHYTKIKGSVVFQHDLLKSAFYLLSGYQEIDSESLDSMGRFPYERSVQYQLNCVAKPLVNYYFEMIWEGLSAYGNQRNLVIEKRNLFNEGAVMVTHDVDIVDTYTLPEVVFRIKQALGLAQTTLTSKKAMSLAVHYLLNYLNIFSSNNPHWDFPFIRKTESEQGIRSVFYFLPKDQKHTDAYYRFSESRIKNLISELDSQGCEIALHGTVRSATSGEALKENLGHLNHYSPKEVVGIRQHRLTYSLATTPVLQQQAGLQYDSTLGFAEHEGFRHSFCLPYKVYDHKSERMLDLWEIPLNAMDVSLFSYRDLSLPQAMDRIDELLEETKHFKGVCTLLWHNGISHERLNPGMKKFYKDLMKKIAVSKMESLLGKEIIDRMNSLAK